MTPEQWLLGQLLLNKMEVKKLKKLKWDKYQHVLIYKAMHSLVKANKPVDLITLTEALHESDLLEIIGGAIYLAQLADWA